jgi:hypothetical protein
MIHAAGINAASVAAMLLFLWHAAFSQRHTGHVVDACHSPYLRLGGVVVMVVVGKVDQLDCVGCIAAFLEHACSPAAAGTAGLECHIKHGKLGSH